MKFQKLVNLSYKMLDLPDSRHKHFSFILIRNKILAVGYNLSYKTNPLAKKYGYYLSSIHSELAAVKNFPYPPSGLSKCKMVNIRIMANNELGMSRPCKNCQRLLKDFDISEVWHTNRDGEFERV